MTFGKVITYIVLSAVAVICIACIILSSVYMNHDSNCKKIENCNYTYSAYKRICTLSVPHIKCQTILIGSCPNTTLCYILEGCPILVPVLACKNVVIFIFLI